MESKNPIIIETAIFAGGCFWCLDAVFRRVKGVQEVVSGFAGGFIKRPPYREVRTGRTGHAEAVKLSFDATQITYQELLDIFFSIHDPTTLNQQGHDKGTQYRSAIFYKSEAHKEIANLTMQKLQSDQKFPKPIVTELKPLDVFYVAEEVHQNYYDNNVDQPYCELIILPKLELLKKVHYEKLKKNSN